MSIWRKLRHFQGEEELVIEFKDLSEQRTEQRQKLVHLPFMYLFSFLLLWETQDPKSKINKV